MISILLYIVPHKLGYDQVQEYCITIKGRRI